MGLWGNIAKTVADTAASPFSGPITAIANLANKFIEDPEKRQQFELQMAALQQQGMLSQLEVNKAEAQSSSLFVAGARPWCIWLFGTIIGFTYLGMMIVWMSLCVHNGKMEAYPAALSLSNDILMGLLGFGGARTVEKLNGVARDKF